MADLLTEDEMADMGLEAEQVIICTILLKCNPFAPEKSVHRKYIGKYRLKSNSTKLISVFQ